MNTDNQDTISRQWTLGQLHEADFEVFRDMSISAPVFLDVGANIGQSAISFMVACPEGTVISFEPNRLFDESLTHVGSLIPRFTYYLNACGDADGQFTLIIPVVDGVNFCQEASLDDKHFDLPWVKDRLSSYGSCVTFERIEVLVRPLDGFGLAPDIVKVDAEGWELNVLKGMRSTLEAHHPIFLIENNDYTAVTAFLHAFGYEPYRFDPDMATIMPLDRATTNTLYLRPTHLKVLNRRYTEAFLSTRNGMRQP